MDGAPALAWVERVHIAGDGFVGRPLGQDLGLGEAVEFTLDQVIDWSEVGHDGRMHGNFTARALMETLPDYRAALIATTLSLDLYPADW